MQVSMAALAHRSVQLDALFGQDVLNDHAENAATAADYSSSTSPSRVNLLACAMKFRALHDYEMSYEISIASGRPKIQASLSKLQSTDTLSLVH